MEIYKANRQWASRPEDERFTTLEALHAAALELRANSRERADVPVDTLRVEAVDGDVQIIGRAGSPAKLTHWAFGQLAARIGAPASYLRGLPATLAAQNVNHGLARRVQDVADGIMNLLFMVNGGLTLQALTSARYVRVWHDEITARLIGLTQTRGWEVARPDFNDGGDGRRPLYLSDHDLFAFIRNNQRTVMEGKSGNALQRGLIVENSTVGASKLRLTRFLYRAMCGNHIIWDASQVTEIAVRHVGNIREQLASWDVQINRYLDSSASDDEYQIERARTTRIAASTDDVLDALFGKASKLGLSQRAITAGVNAIVEAEDGDPLSVWGVAQGLTRYSQTIPYADERTAVDRSAGKLLAMVDAF